MSTLEHHLTYLRDALAEAEAHPLSRRRAMLCVMLIDAYADRTAEGDRLVFREKLAAGSAAMGLVFEVAAARESGARLVTETVKVDAGAAAGLREADYMVSLYNGGTVQRVRVARGDERWDAIEVLREAVGILTRKMSSRA